jgi:acetylornithine deacetylase/succinyl-diaminopimelate desuccinylase family protein
MYEDIVANIDKNEITDLLGELVKVPSINPPGNEGEVAIIIQDKLDRLGLDIRNLPSKKGRANLVATKEGKGESLPLWFNGHMDVQPPGSGWKIDPFGAEIIDGCLYGRGSVDMKAGLTAAIMAVSTIVKSDIDLKGDLVLNAVSDEVSGGFEGSGYIVREHILKNKIKKPGMVIVCEPTKDDVRIAHRGDTWLELTVTGKSAHSARPWMGVNAISEMAKIILKLESDLPDIISKKKHWLLPSPNFNVGVINGGIKPNLVPDVCKIQIDRRTLPGETNEKILDEIKNVLGKQNFEPGKTENPYSLETIMELEATEISPNEPIIKECVKAYTEVIGKKPNIGCTAGFEDAHFFINEAKIPTAMFGPYYSCQSFKRKQETSSGTYEENVDLGSVVDATKIYIKLILNILGNN